MRVLPSEACWVVEVAVEVRGGVVGEVYWCCLLSRSAGAQMVQLENSGCQFQPLRLLIQPGPSPALPLQGCWNAAL